jgi:hypothetical protein
MNTAVLLLSACTVGADPSVVQASGWAKGGDCCGKAVVVDNSCAPKCGCGFFSKLKHLCSRPCKPACDVCPKPVVHKPVCQPCPKPAPVCNKCEKTHTPCDTCAPKKKHCGLFSCLNFHINLCHGCGKGHGHKGCDKGCGTTVIAPATPVAPPAPITPAPKPDAKAMPKVGSNYNPAERPETVPVITQSNGKIIIDVVPQN